MTVSGLKAPDCNAPESLQSITAPALDARKAEVDQLLPEAPFPPPQRDSARPHFPCIHRAKKLSVDLLASPSHLATLRLLSRGAN